jgi:flagellar basal body-associated protein FliL
VIKKPRERGGHSPRWAAEPEMMMMMMMMMIIIIIIIVIIIVIIITIIHLIVKNIAEHDSKKSDGPGFSLLLQTLEVHLVVTKSRYVILSQINLPYIVEF